MTYDTAHLILDVFQHCYVFGHVWLDELLQLDDVETLSSALATFGAGIRQAISQADEIGDKGTEDIFTEIWRGVDKYLWFVEAHHG